MLGTVAQARRERLALVSIAALALAVAWYLASGLIPTSRGFVGHDYAYFFPRLLANAYWAERNGAFSIPWFTPAFGGGLPSYAHPASFYVSAPQAFVLAGFGAISAAQLTYMAFVAAGFFGTWKLCRGSFAASVPAAAFGACAFAWNAFFLTRMAIGHLGFHSLMLTPLAAHFCLRPLPSEARARRARIAFDGLVAGAALAYFFQSGNFYGLVPAALAIVALALVAVMRGASFAPFAWRFSAAVAWSLALCAAKLCASLAFLAHAPREGYPLPGAESVYAALRLAFGGLFVFPPTGTAAEVLRNTRYGLNEHEWDFNVTWVVGAWLVVGLYFARRLLADRSTRRRNALALAALLVVLAIPIAVNVYSADWNAVLKRVPIVRNSSSLFRWFVAYVPVVVALAALALDRVGRRRALLASISVALVAIAHATADRAYYAAQPYDPASIESALSALRERGEVRAITKLDAPHDAQGRIKLVGPRDDAIASGVSQILPYEPMFGYALEWFPIGSLHGGDPLEAAQGALNFKDPAGYLFPIENNVDPGGHFRVGDEERLRAFLDYRPLAFEKSASQRAAESINALALCAAIAVLAWASVSAIRVRASGRRDVRRDPA